MIFAHQQISSDFVQALFDHQLFQQRLTYSIAIDQKNFDASNRKQLSINTMNTVSQVRSPKKQSKIPISELIQDISSAIVQNTKLIIDRQLQQMYQSNLVLMKQIEKIKKELQKVKAKVELDTNLRVKNAGSQQYYLDSIIHQNSSQFCKLQKNFQQKMEKISQVSFLNSSGLQSSQVRQQEIHEKIFAKIDCQIKKIDQNLTQSLDKTQKEFQRKLQSQNKTIQNLICLIHQINNNPEVLLSPVAKLKQENQQHRKSPNISSFFGLKKGK